MTDDLVKRLRELANDQDMLAPDNTNDSAELREAADRIEQLESLFPAILEYLEDQSDVVDSSNGIGSPNKAMALLFWTKHELEK